MVIYCAKKITNTFFDWLCFCTNKTKYSLWLIIFCTKKNHIQSLIDYVVVPSKLNTAFNCLFIVQRKSHTLFLIWSFFFLQYHTVFDCLLYCTCLQNQRVPADMVLLRTSEKDGGCFIRTDQLDGETDWKLRLAVQDTQRLPANVVSWLLPILYCF